MRNNLLVSDNFAEYSNQNETNSQLSDGFRPRFQGVNKWLNQTARALAYTLMGSSNPFIWQKTDRNGNTWWIIDDPLTGNRFHAVSEEEVRAWIDQHYYAQPNSIQNNLNSLDSISINRW